MFTGIIEATAEIKEKLKNGIIIFRPDIFGELTIGQSICVNGACLSVVEFSPETMRFDVVPETFARTNLQEEKMVNLERALPVSGRFEGHIVSGHVDTTAKLLARKKEALGELFTFALPSAIANFVVEKGSIALNGVSLTVAQVSNETFSIALIPHTLENTNLGTLQEGESVNVETDIMAKYWHKWC